MSNVAAFLDCLEEGDEETTTEVRSILVVAHKLGPFQAERARKLFAALVDYDVTTPAPEMPGNRKGRRAAEARARGHK